MKKKNLIHAALIIILIIGNSLFGQQEKDSSKINLTDYDNLKSYLNLSIDQQKIIEPLVTEIQSIIDSDEKAIQDMRSKMQSMGMRDPSMREKMMNERAERESKIDGLVKQIELSLNKKQLEKFNEIEKPNLMNKSRRMN